MLYPFVRRVRFQTAIAIAANGSEQRAAGRGVPLFEGTLTYNRLPRSERDSLTDFFNARGGKFDNTWDMTVNGVGFTNLSFTDDTIQWRESPPNLYSSTLNWRQVNNPHYVIPSVGASFPTLQSGAFCQLPYSPESRQLTTSNDQPTGWSYSYRWYGAGLTNFPKTALRRWGLANPSLSDTDAQNIENHFIGCLGMYKGFTVTDPEDLTVQPNVRYQSDVLEIQYLEFRRTQISLILEEFFA